MVDPNYELYASLGYQMPDVIIVRKTYDKQRKKSKAEETDIEKFLEEIEEDLEIRSRIALYRDPNFSEKLVRSSQISCQSNEDNNDKVPEVPLTELLEMTSIKT